MLFHAKSGSFWRLTFSYDPMIQYDPILRRIWTAPPVPGHPSPPVTLWMFKKKPFRWTGSGWYWHVLAEAHVWYFRTFLKFKRPQRVSPPRTKTYLQREELIRTDAVPNWQLHIKQLKRKFKPFKSYESVTNHMPLLVVCVNIYIYIYTCDIPLYFISYIFHHHISRDVEHILVPQTQWCHPVIFLWSINPISKWYTV